MNSKFRIQQRIKEHSTRQRLFESKSLGRIGTSLGSSWLAHAIRQHTRPRPRDDVLLLNHPSKKLWRQTQVIINQVWVSWVREYLPTLIARKKWNQSTNVKVGDLVLVVDEKTQRGDWPLARIMKIFPGKDDTVHVYEVKTKAGVHKKPVAKLVLLEECPT